MSNRSSKYSRDNYTHRRGGAALRTRRKRRHRRMGIGTILIIIVAAIVVGVSFLHPSSPVSVTNRDSLIRTAVQGEERDALPTPIMAECNGVQLHCAVASRSLTEVLFHNASYGYALPMTTQLTEATNTEVMANHGTGRVASEQPTGDEWMTGQFIRCFRSSNGGPQMSAIDCGGAEGTTVYAPVSGTVVRVKEYDLYGDPNHKDFQIHIQPEGHKELDVVLIHLTDVEVAEGDTVVAGETSLAKIRDVYAWIGNSMQLRDYTAEGDNGNHTHIQVNNVNDPNYHGLD